MSIKQRKKDHVSLTASGRVSYTIPTGFEQYQFVHNALPEVDVEEVSTEAVLLGRTFAFPLFISSMTGGYTDAGAVNTIIARFCNKYDLPFGVGSQRIMLEDPEVTSTFSVVRKNAPDAFIAANIGGVQLAEGIKETDLRRLIDSIEANAIIVHLNALQELMQPEGDRTFKGVEAGINQLCASCDIPVIVKETGAGISGSVANRLLKAGVQVIDVAGAGGTSWARVENSRDSNERPDPTFNDWGMSTIECLQQVHPLKEEYQFDLIASGGVRSAHDIAKSLCLQADFSAAAQPVIKAIIDDGLSGIEQLFLSWKKQLITILTLLGCKKPADLSSQHIKLNRLSR